MTGIPIVDIASKVIVGKSIKELGYEPGLQKKSDYIAIKQPVFSLRSSVAQKSALGPEMKSTGEVLGIARISMKPCTNPFLGAGINLPRTKKMILHCERFG